MIAVETLSLAQVDKELAALYADGRIGPDESDRVEAALRARQAELRSFRAGKDEPQPVGALARRSTKGQTFETRPMRCARMPRRSLPYRFVRSHGIMPILDVFLSSSQVRTLQWLICRTGRGQSFTTLTSWLAADLGWHVRTMQRHLRALREQGYIRVSDPDPKSHRIMITLTERCEVAPPIVRKKTRPQAEDLKGTATTQRSPTDDTRSLRKKGANPSAETGAAVGTSAPAPASCRAPEQKESGLPPQASEPDTNRVAALETRQCRAFGKAEGAASATVGPVLARRPDPGPPQAPGGQEGPGRTQTLADARGASAAAGEPEPDPTLDAVRRAAAADWAMARIRGKV